MGCQTRTISFPARHTTDDTAELWDMTRPLLGSCSLQLLKFGDPEAKAVFWHSSAHVLGQALEKKFGAHLTIGPPVQDGFYYDCYMGQQCVAGLQGRVGGAAAGRRPLTFLSQITAAA